MGNNKKNSNIDITGQRFGRLTAIKKVYLHSDYRLQRYNELGNEQKFVAYFLLGEHSFSHDDATTEIGQQRVTREALFYKKDLKFLTFCT